MTIDCIVERLTVLKVVSIRNFGKLHHCSHEESLSLHIIDSSHCITQLLHQSLHFPQRNSLVWTGKRLLERETG